MSALTNAKHERFAQEIAKGASQKDAYITAGYKAGNDAAAYASASRLLSDARISARVAEIMERAATRVEISVASTTEALLRIAMKAESLGEAAGLQAARAAHMDAAKLNGLVVDRTDNTNHNVGGMTDDELAHIASGGRDRASGAPPRPH